MQGGPSLFKPVPSQELGRSGEGSQKNRSGMEGNGNGALHMQPVDSRVPEGAAEQNPNPGLQIPGVPRGMDPMLAYHQETARIMADGMTIANAPIHPVNLGAAGIPGGIPGAIPGTIPGGIPGLEGAQGLQFTALHNPMVVDSQGQDPNRSQTMPFQQLLQEPLPMQIPMSPAQFEAAARRIAWNTIAPGQSQLGPTQYYDRDDPAWRVWEERMVYYKQHGIGNNGKRERMVYTRPMPHAKRSLGQISPEEEAADRESCRLMNDYLVQKFERLKQFNMLPQN